MLHELAQPDIKHIPPLPETRQAIRDAAVTVAQTLDESRGPAREELERAGQVLLDELALPQDYLGFTMVAISNAFWRVYFATVPYQRRLLLLPRCLSDSAACTADFDTSGLHCGGCGCCEIPLLTARAKALGYQVVVAEGTSSVLLSILDGAADALLGVACLDSLEHSFARVADLGIPNLAVPLLTDGCRDTEVEIEEIHTLLALQDDRQLAPPQSCLPILRETTRIFEIDMLTDLLAPYRANAGNTPLLHATDDIALDWLRHGGKRLRPFITLATYAVGRHGEAALAGDADVSPLIPMAARRLALTIEALHKASLVHDDIEDDDEFRYGRRTLHREYGIPPAVNVGDFLVGLGYRLIAGEAQTLGTACTTDILARLSTAHLELCRGQGAELLWMREREELTPRDVLAIYALKTAPAFEVAVYAGLRAAKVAVDDALLKRLSTYIGEGFQIINDLEDWRDATENKGTGGQDVLAVRPTLLRAFAVEAGGTAALNALSSHQDPQTLITAARMLYAELGAFHRAEQLLARLRERALELAGEMPTPALRELMRLLTRIVLYELPPETL